MAKLISTSRLKMRTIHMIIGGVVLVALLAPPSLANNFVDEDEENNDFAEFEDFDGDEASFASVPDVKPPSNKQGPEKTSAPAAADDFQDAFDDNDDDDGIVEEDTEFEHFRDDEEFEGFAKNEATEAPSVPLGEPKLTMANVPMHFR